MSLSFVLGALLIALFRSDSAGIWDVGVALNVGLNLAFGFAAGRTGQWDSLIYGTLFGAVVVILRLDLVLAAAHETSFLIVSDVVGLIVAVIGMAGLLLTGAVIGWLYRLLRRGCGRWRPRDSDRRRLALPA